MNTIIERLLAVTALADLSSEFEAPHSLSTCIQRIEALENAHYDVRMARKAPLVFNAFVAEKSMDAAGEYHATIGVYYQVREDAVAFIDLHLSPYDEATTVIYTSYLRQDLKTKLYIHLIVILVLVVLTITQSDAILFFGIFFLITVYTIFQEWSELKNVKEGLFTLVERSLN